MPTIKDIAKAAGVSHGTVSNVLNGKGNVSVEKIKRVEDAAKQMGYQINASAKSLREGRAKTVSIILPNISSEQYNRIYSALNHTLEKFGYSTNLYTTNDQKKNELSILEDIASNRDYAVVTLSCLDDAAIYYEHLKIDKENVVFVHRKLDNAVRFIGFDLKKAGKSVARELINKKHQRIGIFTNLLKFSSTKDFNDGLMGEFSKHNYNAVYFSIPSSHATDYNNAFEFFAEDKLDVIVTTDIEKARYIKNAHMLGNLNKCPEIYSLSDSEFIIEDSINKYHLNYRLLGNKIAQMIVNNESREHKKYKTIVVENKGFLFKDSNATPQRIEKSLNILALPGPSTNALKKILPHFIKKTGINVQLAIYPFEEIYDILSDIKNHQHYDIIRIDMAGLPWFAEKTLKPLYPEIQTLLSGYPSQLNERFAYVNDTPYAVPFDPSIQMLFYRKDIFEDTKIRRMFYEKYKLDLEIPTTFEELNRISEFFSHSRNPESPLPYGTCVSTGNTEIIASEFLLRYYAKGGKLIQDNNTLALTPKIAKKALQNYMDHLHIANHLPAKWWDQSISRFSEGDLAIIIVYMNLFSDIAHSSISPLIGFSQVPGDNPLLGGGSLGISKYSQKEDEAIQFFNWVYSDETAEQITLLGGSSVNDFVYDNQNIMNKYPWLKFAVDKNYEGIRESSFKSGESFNLRKVEQIIGLGLKNTINNMMTIEETIEYINRRLSDNDIFNY